jgi:transglutaminase-like putative cysteine protease
LLSLPEPRGGRAVAAEGIEKGQDAVVLEESMEIDIRSITDARVRYLNRTQVLTQRGAEEHDVASVFYGPGRTVRDLRGSVTSPSGKRVEVKKQQMFDGAAFADFELYSDSKHRSLSFPGVVPGAIVEHSYELAVENLFYLDDLFYLQDAVPARLKTLTVRAPSSFPLRLPVIGATPEYNREERDGATAHRWQVKDVPAFTKESGMPPEEDLRPRVLISPKEIVWGTHRIDAGHWDGIAAFYWELARERMVPTPEVAQRAKGLTAEIHEPEQKVRRLYEFVQSKVNYVAIELGIGGLQPHPNGDVLRLMYGDCKDKATLLIAMLKAVGLRGFPVLILTRDAGLIERDNPSLHFNHAIVAVPAEDGYLFMDPTWETVPYGELPWTDQGVAVLVVKEDGRGDLVETPLASPERNRRHMNITGAIAPTGAFEGTCVIDAWGQRRVNLAPLLQAGATEREDALEDLMAALSPGAQMKAQEVIPPKGPADPLRLSIRFAIPGFVTRAGAFEVVSPHLGRFPSLTTFAAYPKRRHPIFFNNLFSDSVETRLTLPVGRTVRRLPVERKLEGAGLTASTRYELARDGERNVLVVRRSVSVGRREIPAAEYPALRTFLLALAEEEAGALTLQPEN